MIVLAGSIRISMNFYFIIRLFIRIPMNSSLSFDSGLLGGVSGKQKWIEFTVVNIFYATWLEYT